MVCPCLLACSMYFVLLLFISSLSFIASLSSLSVAFISVAFLFFIIVTELKIPHFISLAKCSLIPSAFYPLLTPNKWVVVPGNLTFALVFSRHISECSLILGIFSTFIIHLIKCVKDTSEVD